MKKGIAIPKKVIIDKEEFTVYLALRVHPGNVRASHQFILRNKKGVPQQTCWAPPITEPPANKIIKAYTTGKHHEFYY
jgi:hypothetical protein